MLLDLQPGTVQHGELALQDDEALDRGSLMTTMDGLNLCYSAQGWRAWSMKQERRTPRLCFLLLRHGAVPVDPAAARVLSVVAPW